MFLLQILLLLCLSFGSKAMEEAYPSSDSDCSNETEKMAQENTLSLAETYDLMVKKINELFIEKKTTTAPLRCYKCNVVLLFQDDLGMFEGIEKRNILCDTCNRKLKKPKKK